MAGNKNTIVLIAALLVVTLALSVILLSDAKYNAVSGMAVDDERLASLVSNNGTNLTWDNGAKIWSNTTCIIMSSPAGTGVLAVCD
jgi:uncharacterized protein involved in exopolysaccharide biosynthesis